MYATPTELVAFSLPASVLADVSTPVQTEALANASALADSYLASRYRLPLVSWGRELRQAVCDIAAYLCMKRLGFRPGDVDRILQDGHDTAIAWLRNVSSGLATPDVVATAPETSGAGRVTGNERRGW